MNELNVSTGNTDFQNIINKHGNLLEPFPSSQGHSKYFPTEFNIIWSINCKYLADRDNLSIECKNHY